MLKEKKNFEQEVISIKLTSGEEIVGVCVDQDSESITVSQPYIYADNLQLSPWLKTSSETQIRLNKKTVIAIVRTETNISVLYTESTTTENA